MEAKSSFGLALITGKAFEYLLLLAGLEEPLLDIILLGLLLKI